MLSLQMACCCLSGLNSFRSERWGGLYVFWSMATKVKIFLEKWHTRHNGNAHSYREEQKTFLRTLNPPLLKKSTCAFCVSGCVSLVGVEPYACGGLGSAKFGRIADAKLYSITLITDILCHGMRLDYYLQ